VICEFCQDINQKDRQNWFDLVRVMQLLEKPKRKLIFSKQMNEKKNGEDEVNSKDNEMHIETAEALSRAHTSAEANNGSAMY